MTPRFLHDHTCLLDNERGVTLMEVLVTSIVLSLVVLSVYIGIQYAEKQSTQNLRNRTAILMLSGELDRQYFVNKYNTRQDQGYFQVFANKEVVLDHIKKNQPLLAYLSVSRHRSTEFNGAQQYPFYIITAQLDWTDPGSGKPLHMEMREDYFIKAGQ